MKRLNALKKLLFLFLALILLGSCSNDDDNTVEFVPETIVELAQATPSLSSLVSALQRAGLVNTLNGSQQFTVFAPTNDAFTAFLAANNFASLEDIPVDVLTQVLLNHVIAGEFASTDLSTGYISTSATQVDTGLNLSMLVDTSSGVTLNGVSNVDTPNIDATNGIIHIVDAVIGLPTVVTHALANSSFTSLVAALGAADGGLVDVLNGTGPFTVLAPDVNAFTDFLDGTPLANVPTDTLANILLNHVVSGVVTSTNLVDGGSGYTNTLATGPGMNNLSLYFDTSDGVTFNGISSVTTADVVCLNGIIHAIDTVIGIPTVVTFATADPLFSTLVDALTTLTPATDFVSILSRTADGNGDGINPPFTIFAPTNDAFAAITVPEESILTQVLLHHVVGGLNVQSGDLTPNGDTVAPSLQGDNLTITLPGTGNNIANITDGSGVSDIGIIAVDVQAGNGVIHVINKVAIPNIP
ncbi:fasciclin domain-containing protein [Flavivirga spongiicola]|uniref:Fasciclin domain-containing protein n=1 Tax=Flavivirga spongiicola TaxID=421621 RepID=A0ABU7XZ96_9FLAO|nr:fasciclin domain-containing protein [Flavivirga sp. MEBiC05379]MDO5981104.1 fasciclin domain-containing protein [Flavivirga sp. MEBiC05379]